MMTLKDARISILINGDSTTIELIDNESSTTFAKVKLTPDQLSKALSRQAYTPCEITLRGLDVVGKTMEHKKFEFIIPSEDLGRGEERSEALLNICNQTIPEGWVADSYFGSQDTFFEKNGVKYARTTIRRYV